MNVPLILIVRVNGVVVQGDVNEYGLKPKLNPGQAQNALQRTRLVNPGRGIVQVIARGAGLRVRQHVLVHGQKLEHNMVQGHLVQMIA